MTKTIKGTTMICLFHQADQAEAAVRDLVSAGIPKSSIGRMGKSESAANPAAMEKWCVPERDKRLLMDGISNGGVVIAVTAPQNGLSDKVQAIFERLDAGKGERQMEGGGVRMFQRRTDKTQSVKAV